MRIVKDIIDNKAKTDNIVAPETIVIDALKKMIEINLSYLVVMEGEDFKGIFSERDYTRNLVLKGRSSRDTTVGEVMTTDLPVVSLTDTVEDCMFRMNVRRGIRYLLVFDENKFTSVITIHDLLREVLTNKEEVFNHSLTKELLDNDETGFIY